MNTLMSEGSSAEKFVWVVGLAENLFGDNRLRMPSSFSLLDSVLDGHQLDEHFVAEVFYWTYVAESKHHLFPRMEDHLKFGSFNPGNTKRFNELWNMVDDSIDHFVYFLENEPSARSIQDWVLRHLRRIGNVNVIELIEDRFKDNFMAKEFRHEKGSRWAFVTPCAHTPGDFRYTCFDSGGLINHESYRTAAEAFRGMLEAGYTVSDIGAIRIIEPCQAA